MYLSLALLSSFSFRLDQTVVGDAPVFEKTHPAFCQCMMCQTTTSVQNMTVYGAEDSDEDVNADTVKIEDETEVPEKYQITAKDVKLGTQIGEGAFGSVFKGTWSDTENFRNEGFLFGVLLILGRS